MVDIIKRRQEIRASKVANIKQFLIKGIFKDEEEILLGVMVNMDLSEKTAKEYIRRAKFEIETDKALKQQEDIRLIKIIKEEESKEINAEDEFNKELGL